MSLKNLSIGFFCNEYPPDAHGGIGSFTQSLGRALVKSGHRVTVFGLTDSGKEFENDQGVHVYRIKNSRYRGGTWVDRLRIYFELRKLVQKNDIQLFEFPDFEGFSAGMYNIGCPILIRLHGSVSYFANEMGQSASKKMFALEKYALKNCDHWCSVSQYTADKTKTLFQLETSESAVIYNSVALPKQIGKFDRSNKDVMFVGRLLKKKGLLTLAKAWPDVIGEIPEAQLHIYGSDTFDENGNSIQTQMGELLGSAIGNVHFYGQVTRQVVFDALSKRPLAVFPSYAEAFAIVPLESMAMACPTIYSTRGSGPELIENDIDGLLIDPDFPDQLAAKIVVLIKDRELAENLSVKGHEKIKLEFNEEAVIQRNIDFFKSLISGEAL